MLRKLTTYCGARDKRRLILCSSIIVATLLIFTKRKRKVPGRKIEYSSFLFLGANALPNEMQVDFMDYLEELRKDNFRMLENQLKIYFDLRKISNYSVDDTIAGMLADTDKEFEKRVKKKGFYICHANAILYVIRSIFNDATIETLRVAASDKRTKFLLESYQEILHKILLDIEDLSSLYGESVKGNTEYHSYIRHRFVKPAQLHQVLRQGLYGSVSFHSFIDKEPSAAIGTIRQMIELRIRGAFGAMAIIDSQQNNAIMPLKMSKVFEIVKKHEKDIEFPIKFENIIRIYNWSNSFIHSGLGDYSWIPYYVEFVLRDFSFGTKKDNGWDINNAIVTSTTTIKEIQGDIIKFVNCGLDEEDLRYKLLTCKPECEIRN